MAFRPDGAQVMTGGFDSTVRLWPVDYRDSIMAACQRLTRDLTEAERATYGIPLEVPSCP